MRNVERYLEAKRERDALEQANAQEGSTAERERALREARAKVTIAWSRLTGAQLGALRRQVVRT